MKKLFKSLAYIILLSISSATFVACARATTTMWTAATFASHGVRGFNQPGDISDSSMSDLAATGANVLRFFVDLSPNNGVTAYTYDPAPLASAVASAAKYGFKVVIVPNVPDDSRNQLWGTDPNNSQGISLRASFASIWQQIATIYKGNPAVGAYDLFNEPVVGGEGSVSTPNQNLWISYATALINAIRAIDPDHVIIFEPSPWASVENFTTSLTNPLPFSNIVYSFHDYGPSDYNMQGIGGGTVQKQYPDFNYNSSNLASVDILDNAVSFQIQFNVQIFVGEFSFVRWAPVASANGQPSAYNWLNDTIVLLEAHGWSWIYHDWRNYYGFDADMPESFFYQYPYVNAQPQVDFSLYNSNPVPGDANHTQIGFAAQRSNTTDAMVLLKNYFKSNTTK
jgi:endoglucanase